MPRKRKAEAVGLEEVRYRIEHEGFHYAFESYSDFKEVRDAKFHALRRRYLAAARALQRYVYSGERTVITVDAPIAIASAPRRTPKRFFGLF